MLTAENTSHSIELPLGWCEARLEETCQLIFGQSPPSFTYNEEGRGLPFYQGKLEFGEMFPTPRKWCISPQKIAEKGDVLISIRAPVGPTNLCPERSCIGRGLAAIRPLGGIESLFVLYLMRANERAIASKGTGTTFSAITSTFLRTFAFWLPPRQEQKRIVSKIEELFTKLDAGIESLKKAKLQLKHYRQSLLKAAFEGKLTEEWRKERGTQEQLDWQPTTLGKIITLQYGKSLIEENRHSDGRIPVYGSNGMIGTHDIALSEGPTLIIGRKGAYRGAVHYSKFPCWVIDTAYFVEPSDSISLSYLYYLLMHLKLGVLDKSSAIPGINRNDVYRLKVRIPSLEEQIEISNRVEETFSFVGNCELVISNSLRQSERLRQSTLVHAFEGKLVPQDSNDEPAEKLLSRIIQYKNANQRLIES